MVSYPGAVKSFTDPTSSSKLNSTSHADQHIDANDEINAIETELGVDPAGAYSTVVLRQDAEYGRIVIPVVAAAGATGTFYITVPSACTIGSGYLNCSVSAGSGRSMTVSHGSAGDDLMAVATFTSNGTIGVAIAFTASATTTVTAAEVLKVSWTSCATAQHYGITMVMTSPT